MRDTIVDNFGNILTRIYLCLVLIQKIDWPSKIKFVSMELAFQEQT